MSSGCISTRRTRRWCLCCDEKSQCQALERTQPGLPLGIGHIRTKTHDYVRHGTLTLFAALNYLEGKLITRLAARHRHQEWLAFLKTIDEETPGDLAIHIIADNYATHKHPAVTRWLDRHARFHMHYTPTSSSWMNLVERFFRDLTEFITEKSFASTRELADAIIAFLAARNENPQRYVWKAKGEDILRKTHYSQKIEQLQQWQSEDREVIAFDPLEQLHSSALEPIGADRAENCRSFDREIIVEESVAEMSASSGAVGSRHATIASRAEPRRLPWRARGCGRAEPAAGCGRAPRFAGLSNHTSSQTRIWSAPMTRLDHGAPRPGPLSPRQARARTRSHRGLRPERPA